MLCWSTFPIMTINISFSIIAVKWVFQTSIANLQWPLETKPLEVASQFTFKGISLIKKTNSLLNSLVAIENAPNDSIATSQMIPSNVSTTLLIYDLIYSWSSLKGHYTKFGMRTLRNGSSDLNITTSKKSYQLSFFIAFPESLSTDLKTIWTKARTLFKKRAEFIPIRKLKSASQSDANDETSADFAAMIS